MDNIPTLIEPGTKYFIKGTLKQCRTFKEKYINSIFNIGATIALCITVGAILWWRYKGKLTATEIAEKIDINKNILFLNYNNYLPLEVKITC